MGESGEILIEEDEEQVKLNKLIKKKRAEQKSASEDGSAAI